MFKWFEYLLKKIAEANEKNFKGKRLDCCDLSKEEQGKDGEK